MNIKKTLLGCLILTSFQVSTGHSQTLKEAIQLTLDENPEVQEARSTRLAYEQEIDQAASRYLPTLDVSAGYGLEQANTPFTRGFGGTGGSGGTTQYGRTESSVQLRQMVFDGFETPHEVDRFTAKTDAQAYTVFGKSEMVGLQAAQAYIGVLRRQALLDLAQDNLETHKSFFDQIQLRTERGVGRQSDLDQATGRLANAESNYRAEEGNLRDAETNFYRVIGMLPKALDEVPEPTQETGEIPENMDQAVELALANHPILKAADADINEALAQHDTASAAFYPRVDFEVGYDNNDDTGGIRGRNESLTAMMRVRYNLFNGGKDTARRRQTAHEIAQAKNIRDNTYRQTIESIRLSWVAYQTLGNQMDFFKSHRDASIKTLDAYKRQFNIGQRTLLDLLDTTNETYLANLAYTDAKYNELAARYRILAGMGALNRYLGTTIPEEAQPITEEKQAAAPTFK
ncbi:MAG: TolC family outer membrane protein [Methylobacter sp.]